LAIEQLVAHAIVQACALAKPEFDHVGQQSIAAPVRRPRHRHAGEAAFVLGDARVKLSAIVQCLRLQRGPGADLAFAPARGEIVVRFVRAGLLDRAFDPHLHLVAQAFPQNAQCGILVRCKLACLGAVVIGVERETAFVDLLEQDDARRDATTGIGRGQRHCRRLGFASRLRLREQVAHLRDGFGVRGHRYQPVAVSTTTAVP
jgi:hypothetical protein